MKKIVLDPGHGGDGSLTSYGASGNGLIEKDLNLRLAQTIRAELLDGYECDVVLTRATDKDVSFAQRAAFGNGADLFYSIHFNGYHDPAANGFETFIFSGPVNSATIRNQSIIHTDIYEYLKGHGMRDRGQKKANFAVLRLPPCSCVLTEYAFLTNIRDAWLFHDEDIIDEACMATVTGIARALSLPKKQSVPELQKLLLAIHQYLGKATQLTETALGLT